MHDTQAHKNQINKRNEKRKIQTQQNKKNTKQNKTRIKKQENTNIETI